MAGIERAVDPNPDGDPSDHADVVNMSLGGHDDVGKSDRGYDEKNYGENPGLSHGRSSYT